MELHGKRIWATAAVFAVVAGLTACGGAGSTSGTTGGTAAGTGKASVLLTDNPAVTVNNIVMSEVNVEIVAVSARQVGGGTIGPFSLTSTGPVNLLSLAN